MTPSGSGAFNGSDWNNALAGLPATLVRGDTYYIATGNYPRYRFNTPESGTTVITIKKATPTDHCTEAGWQGGFGVGQAVWADNSSAATWQFTDNGYWVIDGQYRTNAKLGHGFRIDWGTKCIGPGTCYLVNMAGRSGTAVTNITFRYLELAGGGVGGNTGDSCAISSAVRNAAGDTATITCTGSHRYLAQAPGIVGSQIAVSGVSDSSFNTSLATVTAATATTVSYANSGSANARSGGGTVTGGLGGLYEFDWRIAGCVDKITFELGYIHDSSDSPFQNDGNFGMGCTPSNLTIQHSVVARNTSNSLHHSAAVSVNDLNCDSVNCPVASIDPNGKYIDRYNSYEDIEGTGFIDVIGRGRNLEIYGDVFVWHQGNPYRRSGIGNGGIDITSSAHNANNWVIYNNSFINIPSDTIIQGASVICSSCSNWTVYNNVCYSESGRNCTINVPPNSVHDWNAFFTTGSPNSESHIQTGTINPFLDWVNEDYHLRLATNGGMTLSAPYNMDPDGAIRGTGGLWNRGAYEFLSLSRPAPPTNLRLVP